MVLLALAAVTWGVLGYYYVSFSRMIDASLHGERDRTFPQVFARPLEIYRGQSLTNQQLIERLNDLGYAQRQKLEKPGEFLVSAATVSLIPRSPEFKGQVVQVGFQRFVDPAIPVKRGAPVRLSDHVTRLQLGPKQSERLTLDAPLLASIVAGEREKRRPVALAAIQPRIVEAVLSIEDRRYYEHPGVDPIGALGAMKSYVTGRRSYLAGGSTITQQLVRNVFLTKFEGMTLQEARRRSPKRKALEIFVSLITTSRASKDEILEMYLNNVPLGQRGSFAIVGVAEGAKLFFGKDVSNLSLAEAATLAGVIQSPSALSPFSNPQRCKDRRNVVLLSMVDAGYIDKPDRGARDAGTARRRPARARSRSAVLRRLRQPVTRGRLPRPHDDDHEIRGRVHHTGPASAAARAGRGPKGTDSSRCDAVEAEARQGGSGADRPRSAHRRNSVVRRRTVV